MRRAAPSITANVLHSTTITSTGRRKSTRLRSSAITVASSLYGYAWIGIVKYTQRRSRPRSHGGRRWSKNSTELASPSEEAEVVNRQDLNKIRCRSCGHDILMDVGNAILYLFKIQPWVSYWLVICDECATPHRCFIRDNLKWECEWALRNEVGTITEDFPSEDELSWYGETYSLEMLTPHDLSDYQEKEIAFFHHLLDTRDPIVELE